MTGPADIVEDTWLTTEEAASRAKCSTITIRRHAAAGTIRSTSAGRGRRRKYRPEWVDQWVENSPRLPVKAAS